MSEINYKLVRNYDGRLFSYNVDRGDPLSVEYIEGEWIEPDIEHSGLYVLGKLEEGKKETVDLVLSGIFSGDYRVEIWKVDTDGFIMPEESFYLGVWHTEKSKLENNIRDGKCATSNHQIELLGMFPSVKIVDRVKLLQKIA